MVAEQIRLPENYPPPGGARAARPAAAGRFDAGVARFDFAIVILCEHGGRFDSPPT